MKFTILLLITLGSNVLFAQKKSILKVDTYKLKNGFTVFLNEDSTANKVFGAVFVNAGSVNESPDATGMAHYLEHMLFKGTDQMGTSNYGAEKPYLDTISLIYEKMALATNKDTIAQMQQKINKLAIKASKYSLPNEFTKLLKSAGGSNINAFTSQDITLFHNLFPANEIAKWLNIYAERFRHPVFRSFQSELEVVYEEKNRSMDGIDNKIFEVINKAIFPNVPYGQWDVLGKVKDLKKPSLNKMQAFYDKNYVAKNMALVLTGNFKTKDVLPLIKANFSNWRMGKAPVLNLPKLQAINTKPVKVRITPIKLEILGWQTVPYNHPDRVALDVCENILSNYSETGLLDALSDENKLMFVGGNSLVYKRVGGYFLAAVPKPLIQSIKNADNKVNDALAQLKKGNFSDDLLQAVKYQLSNDFQQNFERLDDRGIAIAAAFNEGIKWKDYIKYPAKVNAVTREDVINVAKKYFNKNRATIISHTGFPKKVKLKKPPYKAVSPNQKDTSIYAKKFEKIPSTSFTPKFLNFNKAIENSTIFGNQKLTKVANPVNDLFYLTMRFKTGKINNEKLAVATDLMNFAGAGNYNFTALKNAFTTIGCSYYFYCTDNYLTLNISGNNAKIKAAIALANLLIKQPKADENSLKLLLKDKKLSKRVNKRNRPMLGGALLYKAINGNQSHYLTKYSIKEIKKLKVSDLLLTYTKAVNNYKTNINYVGNTSIKELKKLFENGINLAKNTKEDDYLERKRVAPIKNTILFINDKKAVQSQVYYYTLDTKNSLADYYKVKAFNKYFGGGFTGIILQEIREYRSLAYSAHASYYFLKLPTDKGYFLSYVGCQADKTVEAITVLDSLIKNMPQKPDRIASLKQNLALSTVTNYPNFKNIANVITNYERQGFKEDPNKKAYLQYKKLTMQDITAFYKNSIQGKPYVITIYGDKRKIDFNRLKQFGTIKELKVKDIIKF